jgi:hypothetical protein
MGDLAVRDPATISFSTSSSRIGQLGQHPGVEHRFPT